MIIAQYGNLIIMSLFRAKWKHVYVDKNMQNAIHFVSDIIVLR